MQIGLLTCSLHPDLIPEDQQLLEILKKRGHRGEAISWDDPGLTQERVRSLDRIVIRTPWNYLVDPQKFLVWLGWLEQCQVPVWNPTTLIRWNFDKHYLLELAHGGVPIVPSVYAETRELRSYQDYLQHFGCEKLVAKPTISAGAANTSVLESESQLRALSPDRKWILQPFLREIQDEGEWSFVFFDGEFSHALLKTPARGDFRVQEKFQGSWSFQTPAEAFIEQARYATRKIPGPWLYARVDGVRRGDHFYLMELELFEPQLFLQSQYDIATTFVEKMTTL